MDKILLQYDQYVKRPGEKIRYSRKAFLKKFRAVGMKERLRMLVKLMLRLVGVRKSLFLGGYHEEEDFRQELQDTAIYCSMLRDRVSAELPEELCAIPFLTEQEDMWDARYRRTTECIRKKLLETHTYIAIVTENLDSGGLEEVVKVLAMEYEARKLSVKVLCIQEGGCMADFLVKHGIEVRIFHGKQDDFNQYIRANRPFVANTHFIPISFIKALRECQVPVIEVIHNMYVFLNESRLLAERQKAAYVSKYIAVSETVGEIFGEKVEKLPAGKMSVIGNAAEMQKLYEDKDKVRRKLNIPENAFVYLCAGSIDARKNQIGLLRAWDIFLHLAGSGQFILVFAGAQTDQEYGQKVRETLVERGLENSVILTGFYSEISELMNAADVFILDSYYEGWSMAATQALYSGLALIHSDCGSGKELIAGGQNGILTSNPLKNIAAYDNVRLYDAMHAGINENIEDVASAMLKIAMQMGYWKNRRKWIQKYAETNFSVTRMAGRYLEVYLDAAEHFENG